MRIPTVRGVIDRRVLVNFRVDADVLARACPSPFRPQTVGGFGVAGICLIRLRRVRPKFFPTLVGLSSENAAHRIAVEWDSDEGVQSGVYIPRRDTSSRLNSFTGGRIFPGVHHRARFDVRETSDKVRIAMDSVDGSTHVLVDGQTTDTLLQSSIFGSIEECSRFFEAGSLGYSPANTGRDFDGLELRTSNWHVQPFSVTDVHSSFFDDHDTFPDGSVAFDHALLMRGIDHEWQSRAPICCSSNVS